MSQWTHVNASIRFDGIPEFGQLPTENDLGVISTFENWQETDIPCGSEGSIQYSIHRNPHESSLAAMVVVFWGDLRDYEDEQEILDYFKRITDKRMIRSAILEIEIEGKHSSIYRRSYDTEWIKVNVTDQSI